MFCGLFQTLGLPFSGRHNALYGVCEAARLVVAMCKTGRCAATAAGELKIRSSRSPGPDWLLGKLGAIGAADMEGRCTRMLADSAKRAVGRMAGRGTVNIGIDLTLLGRNDKNPDMRHLVKSKYRGGTCTFEAYCTVQCLGRGINVTLGALPFRRGDELPDFVRKLLGFCGRMRVPVSTVLMDRGFFSVGVMRAVHGAHRTLLMPAVKNRGIKGAILEHAAGTRQAVSRYTMTSSYGKKRFTFTLVIIPDTREGHTDSREMTDRYLVFATNLPEERAAGELERLPEEYRQRWGIEVGYREAKGNRARTLSPKASTRLAMFFLTLVIRNLWILSADDDAGRRLSLTVLLAYVIEESISGSLVEPGRRRDPG